ncbi:MAG: NAD-dependent epimerase/dehydratase family protein [Cyclobacteriaceae bacterium]
MIFITGASGLIGSFICRELLRRGHKVRALKRASTDMGLVSDIRDQIEWVEGDLMNVSDLPGYLEGVTDIIHGAAVISYERKDELLMYQVNVDGTANLLNAALDKGISRFLHISSVAAIGKDKGANIITEDSKWQGEKTTAYARSKYQSELEVWRASAEGLKTIIINPSLVLGPGEWHKSSTQVFKYVWDEHRFFTNGLVNYVDVRDVAEIVVQLLLSDHVGERFIVNAGSMTYKELFEQIALEFGKRPPHIHARGGMIRLAILLGKLQAALTGRPPLLSDEMEQVSKNRHIYANEKIKKTINFEFRDIKDTIRWSCEQLKNRQAVHA